MLAEELSAVVIHHDINEKVGSAGTTLAIYKKINHVRIYPWNLPSIIRKREH